MTKRNVYVLSRKESTNDVARENLRAFAAQSHARTFVEKREGGPMEWRYHDSHGVWWGSDDGLYVIEELELEGSMLEVT